MKILYTFLLMSLMLSCGQRNLDSAVSAQTPIEPKVGEAVFDFCTLDPSLIEQKVKFLFVLDISGSNAGPSNGRDATDPDRSQRYDSLVNWLNDRDDNPYEYFSLIEFAGDSADVAPGALNGPDAPFVKTNADFANVVSTQKSATRDGGGTPYLKWEDAVLNIIEADAQKSIEEAEAKEIPLITSKYVVVVLSDGVPTDDSPPFSQIFNKLQNQIMTLPVNPIVGEAIESINVNTGYYYKNQDLPEARELLEELANIGKGEFYSFDTGSGTIDYDQLTRVFFKKVSTTLLDVTLENVNSIWDLESKQLVSDLDGDLLSDKWEILLGSNPLKADSDENGVSDGAESLVSADGFPCKDKQCDPENAFEFTGCWEDAVNKTGLLDTDNDLIPDCEERVYSTNEYKWDSNGNSVPDHLLHKFALPSTARNDENNPTPPAATVDSDFDGLNNAQEIKLNTSPMLDNQSIPGLKPHVYTVKHVEYRPFTQQNCYEVTVEDVNVFYGDDTMRFYVYENEKNQTGRSVLRIFEKRMTNGSVKMSESDLIKISK